MEAVAWQVHFHRTIAYTIHFEAQPVIEHNKNCYDDIFSILGGDFEKKKTTFTTKRSQSS